MRIHGEEGAPGNSGAGTYGLSRPGWTYCFGADEQNLEDGTAHLGLVRLVLHTRPSQKDLGIVADCSVISATPDDMNLGVGLLMRGDEKIALFRAVRGYDKMQARKIVSPAPDQGEAVTRTSLPGLCCIHLPDRDKAFGSTCRIDKLTKDPGLGSRFSRTIVLHSIILLLHFSSASWR